MTKNLIDEITDYIANTKTVSRTWAEDVSISLVSVFSHNAYIRTKIGILKPNLWFIFIGPSGIAYKTPPLKYVTIPILYLYQDKTGKRVLLPKSFSMEGMVEFLRNESDTGIIVYDEISTLFKILQKSYGADAFEFLSELYDGSVPVRYTRKTKLEEVRTCYVCLIGATTPVIYKEIKETPEFFMQGLGNRMLFDTWNGETKEWDELDFFFNKPDIDDEIIHFEEQLEVATKFEFLQMVPTDKAVEIRNEADKKAAKLYESGKITEASYVSKLPTQIYKLAMVRSIGQRISEGVKKFNEVPILDTDLSWAEEKSKKYHEIFLKVLQEWKKVDKIKDQPIETIETLADYVYDIVAKHKKLSRSELRVKTKLKAQQLDEVIQYLISADMIEIKTERTGGRPGVYYIIKHH